MAEIDLFHYSPVPSPLKNLDPRIKFSLLLLYTVLIYQVHTWGLVLLTAIATILFFSGKPSLKHLLFRGKGILILGILIYFATYGAEKNTITALLSVLRFVTTVLLGMCLISTTLPEEIEKAVYWFLKPLPFISASVIATRIRLTFMFIPDLMETAEKIKEARISRCIQRERNPFKKITTLIIPLLSSVIERAEVTAFAMEARCYTDKKHYTLKHLTLKDYAAAAVGLGAAGLSILL